MKTLLCTLVSAAVLGAASPYPLKVGPTRRYLVDQENKPFLIHGDAAWSLISGTTKTEAERYLRDRAAKGFNILMVNLVEHKFKGPRNRDGEAPFTTPGDFATPNEKYFAHADWVIRKAGEYGMVVLLAPCYLGYKGLDEGWYDEVLVNGVEKLRNYGRFVGIRYRGFDNIVWLTGGDREPENATKHMRAMALAIKEADPRHLHSAHCAPERSAADCYGGESWLDVNCTYTYKIVHAMALRDYTREPVMPFFLIESTYEGEHDSTPLWIRRQAYWTLLNGGAGQIMGNRPIWLYDPGWQTALDGPASRDMERLKALFAARQWFDLVPDRDHKLVTAGWGDPDGLEYLAAARTPDGRTAIVYMPTRRAIAVDLSRMSGKVNATWFDPRTGEETAAGEFENRESREFTPPAGEDWVLLLTSATGARPIRPLRRSSESAS
jgi:hypothetical protein